MTCLNLVLSSQIHPFLNMRVAIVALALVACTFAIYDGLSGADLRAALKSDYYSHHTLGYKKAREYMYALIDNTEGEDMVYGIYTDLPLPFPYGYMHTSYEDTPINCEHIVPQSFFGKKDPMVSDVHH
ncbi:endonuclease I, partial [Kipferlia bialata]|eukprot:g12641.t1